MATSERGSASVEHIGLVMLIAALMLACVAALASGPPPQEARELGSAIARKLRCAPALPGPCWQDSLTEAYGRPLGGAIRALAPSPQPEHNLVPVDFRYCRSASCATFTGDPRLTASNRRTTAFTSVDDNRHGDGTVTIVYWLYRPSLGWSSVRRRVSGAEVQALASTPLLESANPKLVPLETLGPRNQYDWAPGEEPPWRWRITT
jgi:hypothetical protein